ncbi:MAG: hypothetical protein QXM53_00770 [Thermofilaceae archaeon]
MARWVKVPGIVLAGGQPEANVNIWVFQPGTTTEIPVYEDQGITQLTQPIKSDEAGGFWFFVDQERYPVIRLYFEKTGIDFTSTNELYDGITLP